MLWFYAVYIGSINSIIIYITKCLPHSKFVQKNNFIYYTTYNRYMYTYSYLFIYRLFYIDVYSNVIFHFSFSSCARVCTCAHYILVCIVLYPKNNIEFVSSRPAAAAHDECAARRSPRRVESIYTRARARRRHTAGRWLPGARTLVGGVHG